MERAALLEQFERSQAKKTPEPSLLDQILSVGIPERQQYIVEIAASLGADAPSVGIEKTEGVAGGVACLVRTRIPVWTIESYRQDGATDEELLEMYPTLRLADLVSARVYTRLNADEISYLIRENASA